MHSVAAVASKNLAIRMDVVRRLDLLRREGESYSDVIARLAGTKPTLAEALRYAREHPVKGPDTLGPRLREIRRKANADAEKRMKRLEKGWRSEVERG